MMLGVTPSVWGDADCSHTHSNKVVFFFFFCCSQEEFEVALFLTGWFYTTPCLWYFIRLSYHFYHWKKKWWPFWLRFSLKLKHFLKSPESFSISMVVMLHAYPDLLLSHSVKTSQKHIQKASTPLFLRSLHILIKPPHHLILIAACVAVYQEPHINTLHNSLPKNGHIALSLSLITHVAACADGAASRICFQTLNIRLDANLHMVR